MAKKVLHIVLRDYHDDYSYQENLLSQKHKELGYDVYVITSQLYKDTKTLKMALHEVGEFINPYGIQVAVLKCKTTSNIKGMFMDRTIGLYDKIFQIAPDIIFVHNFTFNDVRHIVRFAKENPNVRVYADNHNDYYNSNYSSIYGKLKAYFTRIVGKQLNKVTIKFWGVTPWRADFLRDVYKIPAEKVDLLIMGVDEKQIVGKDRSTVKKEIRAKYGIPEDAFLVITGGKLDKRKQQYLLMEAVKNLADKNVWLLAFGTPSEDMVEVFEPYKKVSNIVMPGWMKSEESYPLFLASDLAFFPGTHSVLWEQSVACGVPLVAKRWDGMTHVNVNGNAILLEKVDVQIIEDTIVSLLNTEKYNEMKKQVVECASSFFLKDIALKAIGED